MTAFNIVRFKVKAGREEAFLDAHRGDKARWPGLVSARIVQTGEQAYCLIGEWANRDAIVAARPAMVATLDTFRATLDDQGEGKGITDAASGDEVLRIV
jgi:quinol monooxygenase YgiN